MVADPRADEARRIAGLLAELGWETEIATTGRGAFQYAAGEADCELVLLSVVIDHVGQDDAWAMLRHDCRTAAEGKAAAEAHWRETITRFLEEVTK